MKVEREKGDYFLLAFIYSIAGGMFDALMDAGGDMFLVSNEELRKAAILFANTEGMDIHPAAAVATASLINAARTKHIPKDAIVMLNITGGGELRYKKDHKVSYLKPNLIVDTEIKLEELQQKLISL